MSKRVDDVQRQQKTSTVHTAINMDTSQNNSSVTIIMIKNVYTDTRRAVKKKPSGRKNTMR